jgi:hypothetical protein
MEALGRPKDSVEEMDIPLERDVFLRRLVRKLAGTIQDLSFA